MKAAIEIVLFGVMLVGCAIESRAFDDGEGRLRTAKTAVMRADYGADLDGLARVRSDLAPLRAHPRHGALASYWSGFASWRWALNGVSRAASPDSIQAAILQALAAFEAAIRCDGDFADAEAGAASVAGWLASMQTDGDSTRHYARLGRAHQQRALALEPRNPRVLWVVGGNVFNTPPEFGGDQARAIELWRQALAACDSERVDEPLAPDWGRAEAWMALAAGYHYMKSPDDRAAEVAARAALALQPDWYYVREVLLPQIEARLVSTRFEE
jgi:hypothetical protein